MEYRCISADCHIDLNWLPYDLFVVNASPGMKDRMPYVAEGPDGPMWITKSGLNFGLANGKGSTGAWPGGGKYVAGQHYRLDRMASTGLYSDGYQGICRPTTPEQRILDQDRDGIQAEVIYGLINSGKKMTDRDAAIEFYRIYNDWLADFCGYDRTRFVGLASIPFHNVDVAVAETQRAARLGLGGLDIAAYHEMTPLWDPYWDPFWSVAAEVNLPVHFHAIGAHLPATVAPELPEGAKQAAFATRVNVGPLYMATILVGVIHGGALERFPDLRIVLGESGIGWIPYVLDRMDYEYEEKFKNHVPIKMKPSDYWHRQCRATFQYDVMGVRLLDAIGVETLMWGSDYPHPDGVFPDSQEFIARQFAHLPPATRRQITCDNVGKFYGLMSA